MKDWNPDLYLQFDQQRTQPSVDLVSRISVQNPAKIIDIGCGPGNSTSVLARKWKHADILGIDYSGTMIEKAKKSYPAQKWLECDITKWETNEKYDIVFSNAAIQWIFNHRLLLSRICTLIDTNGTLAFQIPQYDEMAVSKVIDREYHRLFPDDDFSISKIFEFHDPCFYYELLHEHFEDLKIWATSYIHEMDSYEAIVSMIESTGLRPYVDRIHDTEKENLFRENIMQELQGNYTICSNGKILFPFQRLFVLGDHYKNA
jgi:trans-aconitate 2-methyltransferase